MAAPRVIPAPVGILLAVTSAGALFAAGEPLGIGPLAWVALVPLFVAVLGAKGSGRAFLFGLVFGLAYFAIELRWISLFGWMAWTALVVVMALYAAVGTLVGSWHRRSAFAPLLLAGAFVGAELLRDRWPYGAYSWGSAGTTQGPVPGVRWLAGSVGAYGLTFLIAFVSAVIAWRIVSGNVAGWSLIAVVAVLAVFVVGDVIVSSTRQQSRDMELVVVQGNVPRPVQPGQRDRIFQSHMDITTDLIGTGFEPSGGAQRVDRVVVWPEDSIGIGVSAGAFEQVADLAGRTSTPFLVGRSILDERERFLNLVEYIDATGRPRAVYQKRHPVPFGEYVPIPFFRRFVGTLESEIPTDQAPGTVARVFDVDGAKIATPICFESVFPRDFLDFTRKGAEMYVLSTNDASFERTYAAEQHLAHTRMRALETRQWVVQAALSGISATIAPDGEITHATELFEATGFSARVKLHPSRSLYAKTGDLFPMLFAGLAAVATLRKVARRRERSPLQTPEHQTRDGT